MATEPEWSDFRIVCALAEAGSVAGAARDLGVDTSTVSRRLSALEEALGADVCLRTARGITLTKEGHAVLAAGKAMAEAIAACVNTVRDSKQGIFGTVRVTCVNSLVPFLTPLLRQLKESHPELRVDFTADDSIVDLAKGGTDIAVRMVRPKELDLVARKVCDLGWAFYATEAYVAEHGKVTALTDLKQRSLIPYSDKLKGPAFKWFAAQFMTGQTGAHAGSPEAALSIAPLINAIAFAPCAWADSMPQFTRVYPETVQFSDIWLCYHETQKTTARVRVVADALMAFLQERRHIFEGRPVNAA